MPPHPPSPPWDTVTLSRTASTTLRAPAEYYIPVSDPAVTASAFLPGASSLPVASSLPALALRAARAVVLALHASFPQEHEEEEWLAGAPHACSLEESAPVEQARSGWAPAYCSAPLSSDGSFLAESPPAPPPPDDSFLVDWPAALPPGFSFPAESPAPQGERRSLDAPPAC